jgi:signal transduction histidine kinase
VRGDRDRLRQVLLNLVDNAVKYNEPGGSITIRLHCAGPKARVTVSNTGPGIAPEELPRVFDRFHRGNAARRLHAGGCGLGLNIAQWIVAAHRGSLVIDSQPAGRTTTTVSLPCGGAPDPDASVVRTENNSAAHKMTSACSRL